MTSDLLYGLRMLAKRPLFTAIAAISLALGIGLNTAIFTLLNTMLWGSLPYPQPDRIAVVWSVSPRHPDGRNGVSVPDYFAFKERNRSFEILGAMNGTEADFGAAENGAPAERIPGEVYTPELLQALHIQPILGRLFTPADDEVDHAATVIILSYRLWQKRFNGTPDVLSRTVLIDGVKTNIIGVMPPNFLFSDDHAQFLTPVPFNHFQLRGSARFLLMAGRLKPGVSVAQAQSELEPIALQLAKERPANMDQGKPWTIRVQPVREALFGFMSQPLIILQAAVALVLLIACANVAALLLARATARHTEVAIRSALGAGRARLCRQFLTESVLLSVIGGVLGVGLAIAAVKALVAMAPPWFPRLGEVSIDARVLLFSAGISLLTGVVFGLIPALSASKTSLTDALKDATRGGASGGARGRLRAVLVSAQLALALILLAGSGLLIRSFMKMQHMDLGCDPSGLLTFQVRFAADRNREVVSTYKGFPLWQINPRIAATERRVYERLRTVPGAQSVGASSYPPMVFSDDVNFDIEGRPTSATEVPNANFYPVTPNFFQTMKIQLKRGRDFNLHDTTGSPWVAIINETMARRYWPTEDPIGKRIKADTSPDEQPREIIGIVNDVPDNPTQQSQHPGFFVSFFQLLPTSIGPKAFTHFALTFLVRTQGEPMKALAAMRAAVAEIDPNQALADPRTLESYLSEQVQYPRYYSMLLGLFAMVATVLAAVGIYGIMAYAVQQRTREIGIRMALGAGGREVLILILRQAVWMLVAGLGAGIAGALLLTRFISSELWQVDAIDPLTFAGVSLLLVGVAFAACAVPTRRAVSVDPTIALRYE